MSKKILVTGGAGYIGSHCCKLLAEHGYQPVAYDNLSVGHRYAVKWGPLEEGDTCDTARLETVIKKYHPQAVMHFAANCYVGESVENPAKYYQNNIVGSLSLLRAMQHCGLSALVFSSTCATYGNPQTVPMAEDHPQQPINPYGFSKLVVERMLADFDLACGLKSISLRYFNAASADPAGEIGEDHDPETHLIPLVLDVALGRRENIAIFGDDYDTQDGSCVRDYIHVMDLAEAHLLALKRLIAGAESDAFNLGTSAGFSVKQVIAHAEKITGKKITTAMAARRAGDPPTLVADARKANKELGWTPQYASLDVQLEHAWGWHKKHFGL